MSLNSFRTGLGTISSSPVGKWVLFAIGVLLVSSLVLSGVGTGTNLAGLTAAQPGGQAGTDVVALVNGDPITREEYEALRSTLQGQSEMTGRTFTPMDNAAVLNEIIGAKLQLQQAKKAGLTVSDTEVTQRRAAIVDESGLRQKLSLPASASLTDIDTALTRSGNRTLEDQVPDDRIRQLLLIGDPLSGQIGKFQQSFLRAAAVSDADAAQFYTKFHTRHILIGNKTRSDTQAKAQAAEIVAKAKAPGADFAALAKQYSDDLGSKAKGGDDGFIDQTTRYVPEFKLAAFSLKPGEVTRDPVASPQYGYFIIKLDAVQTKLPADYAKNKAKYLDSIKQQKAQDKYQAEMASLRTAAKIDVKDPALAGDRAVAEAQQSGSLAAARPKLQAALASYRQALKANPPALQKASLNASLGLVYQALGQLPEAITANQAALALRPDAALALTTGRMCLQAKQTASAVASFQKASQLAWNDQSTHIQLVSLFQQAGRSDLSAKEGDWLKQYAKNHPAAGGGLPGMPGQPGMPNALPGSAVPQPAGSVHVAVPPARKPAQ